MSDAASLRDSARSTDLEALERLFRSTCPDLPWILAQLGVDALRSRLNDWTGKAGEDAVNALLRDDTNPRRIIEFWQHHLDSARQMEPLEMLVFERRFSHDARTIAPQLNPRFNFEKTLHVCRQHTGIALYDYAKDIGWRRPFVFTRILRLARDYFRAVVAADHLVNSFSRHQFLGKTGVATILISRFEPVTEDDLDEAIRYMRKSIEHGNPTDDAMPYLFEALIRYYDLVGDRETLIHAVDLDRRNFSTLRRGAWHLNMAEVWLRLAEVADSRGGRAMFVSRASEALDQAEDSGLFDPQDRVRHAVLSPLTEAIVQHFRASWPAEVRLRGLRTPFGIAEHVPLLCPDGIRTDPLVDHLVHRMREAVVRYPGEPLHRRVFADVLDAVASQQNADPQGRRTLLQEAVRVRDQDQSQLALDDEPSRIRKGSDLLSLARLTSDAMVRKDGVEALLLEALRFPNSCNPLVILGKEVEESGAISDLLFTQLKRRFAGDDNVDAHAWLEAMAAGAPMPLYKAAAARAIQSADVRRRHLGGRSNTLTIEDPLGISSETFVFKMTQRNCHERELKRSEVIGRFLAENDLTGRFGLIDHLAEIEADDLHTDDPAFVGDGSVLTVRRFAQSRVLAVECEEHPDQTVDLLSRAAEYLAYIHACEHRIAGPPERVRKDLKKKHFGRWLKTMLGPTDYAPYFEQWWDRVGGLTMIPYRDAHAYNWLVATGERTLAVDLEATGWRPIGYELAQLTDDVPLIAVSKAGLEQRDKIINVYRSSLAHGGLDVPEAEVRNGYAASLLVRAVRALSDPAAGVGSLEHGGRLLAYLRDGASGEFPERWARDFLREWSKRRGVPSDYVAPSVTGSRRRHLSRAIAYHLRHDEALAADTTGWVSAELLAEQLNKDGLRVSVDEVLAIASAPDEPRFEVADSQVRAKYGHSIPVDISYDAASEFPDLYHATDMKNLNQIFQQGQGLLPMERQMVHLSSDWRSALHAGRRRTEMPVLLQVPRTYTRNGSYLHAGGSTWLARQVPPGELVVMPIYAVVHQDLTTAVGGVKSSNPHFA
jgi:RNA:NAD 2'-phosphotransferase (TPT1/KptA family)